MANYLYVDNSNVWIEGMHVAAVAQGIAPDIWTAQDRNITAPWSYDFGRLLYFAGGEKEDVAVVGESFAGVGQFGPSHRPRAGGLAGGGLLLRGSQDEPTVPQSRNALSCRELVW